MSKISFRLPVAWIANPGMAILPFIPNLDATCRPEVGTPATVIVPGLQVGVWNGLSKERPLKPKRASILSGERIITDVND